MTERRNGHGAGYSDDPSANHGNVVARFHSGRIDLKIQPRSAQIRLDPTHGNPGPSEDLDARNRDDEPPSPLVHVRELLSDLVLEIPGQNEDVVRPRFPDRVRVLDGNLRTWKKLALLVRTPINRELDEVGTNATVVEQRVPLPGRPIAHHAKALASSVDEELQQVALHLLHA